MEMQKRRPVMLVVLDGWGWREEAADNAIRQARTASFDHLWATCPHAFLHTSSTTSITGRRFCISTFPVPHRRC